MDVETHRAARPDPRARLNIAVTIAVILTCTVVILLIVKRRNVQPPSRIPISVSNSASIGNVAARTIIVEFGDFECPACAHFARSVYPIVKQKYIATGLVRLVFRHYPLVQHRRARQIATLAECAGLQGRFGDVYERLFEISPQFEEPLPSEVIEATGTDLHALRSCATQETLRIEADLAAGADLKVNATPTFFLGHLDSAGTMLPTLVIQGVGRTEDFMQAIQSVLNRE